MIGRAVDKGINAPAFVVLACHDEVPVPHAELAFFGVNGFCNYLFGIALRVDAHIPHDGFAFRSDVHEDAFHIVGHVVVVCGGIVKSLVKSLFYEDVVGAVYNAEKTAENDKQKYRRYERRRKNVFRALFSDYIHITPIRVLYCGFAVIKPRFCFYINKKRDVFVASCLRSGELVAHSAHRFDCEIRFEMIELFAQEGHIHFKIVRLELAV